MRVLVTGGSGFLGRSVIPELLNRGHGIVALARSDTAAATVSDMGAEVLLGNLDNPAELDAAFTRSKADALANLASLGFGHAQSIVDAAEEAGIERAVFVSTTAIFTALPAASRAVRVAAEDAVQASGLQWTLVRPTMIYGRPGDRNMSRLIGFLRRCPVVPLPGGGERLIQPVHVDDLAGFIGTALESKEAIDSAFDVPGPEPHSLRSIVEQTALAIGRKVRVLALPIGPAVIAVRAYERVSTKPRLKVEQIRRLDEDKAFNFEAAHSLGYAPRSFADGIADEVALLR